MECLRVARMHRGVCRGMDEWGTCTQGDVWLGCEAWCRLRLSTGYGFGGFNPQVPVPEPTGSGNPKAGYLAQPQPSDAGLDFWRHGYLPRVPGFQY